MLQATAATQVDSEGVCIACGAIARRRAFGGSDFLECSACGLARLVAGRQREEYWSNVNSAADVSPYWFQQKHDYFTGALELLEGLTSGRRLLDLGGGIGYFAELALGRGWQADLSDISPKARAIAADRIGPGHVLESLEGAEAAYDAVTIWCVIAHVENPWGLLADAHRLLKPGGLVWLTTPNWALQRWTSRLQRLLGRPINFSDHIVEYTRDSLSRVFVKAGFSQPQIHYRGITANCRALGGGRRAFVTAKRAFNVGAYGLSRLGLPAYVSELQITAAKL